MAVPLHVHLKSSIYTFQTHKPTTPLGDEDIGRGKKPSQTFLPQGAIVKISEKYILTKLGRLKSSNSLQFLDPSRLNLSLLHRIYSFLKPFWTHLQPCQVICQEQHQSLLKLRQTRFHLEFAAYIPAFFSNCCSLSSLLIFKVNFESFETENKS